VFDVIQSVFTACVLCCLGLLEPLFCTIFTFFEIVKAANTGIKQSNFINMLKYAYRNVSNTSFHAFLALPAYQSTSIHTNSSPSPVDLVPPSWTNSKGPCF